MLARLWKRLWKLIREYGDLAVAVTAAAVVAALGLLDVLKHDHLTEATLLVLGALSWALIRDRLQRERIEEAVATAIESSTAGRGWHLLTVEYTYDLTAADGSLAIATTRRLLRFLSDDIVAVHEWAGSDGTEEEYECRGGPPGSATRKLDQGGRIWGDTPSGPKSRVIELGELARRGQTFEMITTRKLADAFTSSREQVLVRTRRPTDSNRLTVIWPSGRPPRSVALKVNSDPPQDVTDRLRRGPNGRKKFVFSRSDPRVGDEFQVIWEWDDLEHGSRDSSSFRPSSSLNG